MHSVRTSKAVGLSKPSRVIRCLGSLLAAFLLLISAAAILHAAEKGLSNVELQLLSEAVGQIRGHGLNVTTSSKRITDDILRAYAQSFDEYSDYLPAKEFAAFQESTSSDYFGVQMDVEQKNGVLLLFPFRDGLAARAGIKTGDQLLAVDGIPVAAKSVYVVGSMIRGEEGSTVQLTLRSGPSVPRTLTLRRYRASCQSVIWHKGAQAHLIQITRFTKESAEELASVLRRIDGDNRLVVVDLRGNQGGSLISGRLCADYFLKPGTVLFHLRDRDGVRPIVAEESMLLRNPVTLLQDGATASAAEAFILALTGNQRARSLGTTSYGKGLAQQFLPLSDGSALRLTYAEILGVDKSPYHDRGLAPARPLPKSLLEADFSDEGSMAQLLRLIDE